MKPIIDLPEGAKLALYVWEDGEKESHSSWHYWHLRVSVATVDPAAKTSDDCEYGGVRYGSSCGHLENFQISSQGNADDSPRRLYAWQVGYRDNYFTDLSDMEGMVKILRRVEKYLGAAIERDGYPQTYGQYVGRVAHALGAEMILFKSPKGDRWANGYTYWARKIGDAIGKIDSMVAEWVAMGDPAPVDA